MAEQQQTTQENITPNQKPITLSKNVNKTQKEQIKLETAIQQIYDQINLQEKQSDPSSSGEVLKSFTRLNYEGCHKLFNSFLKKMSLGASFDGQKTWIIFFLLFGLELLTEENSFVESLDEESKSNLADFIQTFWDQKQGGFSGSGGLGTHLGTSYPAILAIALVGTQKAYDIVDRVKMRDWLLSLREPGVPGSYLIHLGGEADLRAVYIAMLAAKLFNITDSRVTEGVAEYLQQCQSYEGGLSPVPNAEAHAGYTFCGVSALAIIGRLDVLDIPRLLNWLSQRQLPVEGGFNGRTNKLVDTCYSLWVGGTYGVLERYLGYPLEFEGARLYDQIALQQYILFTCQGQAGGLKDKFNTRVDFYHTSYGLGGLSLAQRCADNKEGEGEGENGGRRFLNGVENRLTEVEPGYNMPSRSFNKMVNYFESLDSISG